MQNIRKLGARWAAWIVVATAFVISCVVADLSSKASAQAAPGSTTTTTITTGAPSAAGPAVVVPVATVKVTSPVVSDVLDWLLKLAGLAATTAVTVLLQRWLGSKTSATRLAAFTELATQGVAHAEEMGHQALKSNSGKLDSSAKANAAANFVMSMADTLKLKPMAEGAVKNLITAQLGGTRSPTDPGTPLAFPASK